MFLLKKKSFAKGVTLIEVIIGVFLFAAVVLSTTVLFSSASKSKKFSENAQKKYDLAFAALGEVGKYLSTSTTNITGWDVSNTLTVYNYSTRECARFMSDTTARTLSVQKKSISYDSTLNYKDCRTIMDTGLTPEPIILIENFLGNFVSVKLDTVSASKRSGFVTVYGRVFDGPSGTAGVRWIPIQTTVSLRDYLVEE